MENGSRAPCRRMLRSSASGHEDEPDGTGTGSQPHRRGVASNLVELRARRHFRWKRAAIQRYGMDLMNAPPPETTAP